MVSMENERVKEETRLTKINNAIKEDFSSERVEMKFPKITVKARGLFQKPIYSITIDGDIILVDIRKNIEHEQKNKIRQGLKELINTCLTKKPQIKFRDI